MALEQLLANRVAMDFCHRELELNVELASCLNDAQATKAIKEAEVHHANAACALQQAHRDRMLALECEVKVEEGWDCHTFMEAFRGVAVQACLPRSCGALL